MATAAGRGQSVLLWALAGALWAVAVLGMASIGLLLVPVAVLVTVVAGTRTGGRGAPALVVAAVVVTASLLAVQAVTSDGEVGGGSSGPPGSP